jgi:hypothetical protein
MDSGRSPEHGDLGEDDDLEEDEDEMDDDAAYK